MMHGTINIKWNLGVTKWNVGVTKWNVGVTKWNVGVTKWNVGITKWNVGVTKWNVGVTKELTAQFLNENFKNYRKIRVWMSRRMISEEIYACWLPELSSCAYVLMHLQRMVWWRYRGKIFLASFNRDGKISIKLYRYRVLIFWHAASSATLWMFLQRPLAELSVSHHLLTGLFVLS